MRVRTDNTFTSPARFAPGPEGRVDRPNRCRRAGVPGLRIRSLPTLLLLCGIPLFSACANRPSEANIQLRRDNQSLRQEIEHLKVQHAGDVAQMRAAENRGATTPSLPTDRLERLFTTHGLKLGRLTGGADLDPNAPGDDGLRVYVVPTDQDGDPLKAAGAFTVAAFDLALPGDQRVGEWRFTPEQAKGSWVGALFSYGYVLACPWQTVPTHGDLTVKVTFQDELTGRVFEVQQPVKVRPPGGAAPGKSGVGSVPAKTS